MNTNKNNNNNNNNNDESNDEKEKEKEQQQQQRKGYNGNNNNGNGNGLPKLKKISKRSQYIPSTITDIIHQKQKQKQKKQQQQQQQEQEKKDNHHQRQKSQHSYSITYNPDVLDDDIIISQEEQEEEGGKNERGDKYGYGYGYGYVGGGEEVKNVDESGLSDDSSSSCTKKENDSDNGNGIIKKSPSYFSVASTRTLEKGGGGQGREGGRGKEGREGGGGRGEGMGRKSFNVKEKRVFIIEKVPCVGVCSFFFQFFLWVFRLKEKSLQKKIKQGSFILFIIILSFIMIITEIYYILTNNLYEMGTFDVIGTVIFIFSVIYSYGLLVLFMYKKNFQMLVFLYLIVLCLIIGYYSIYESVFDGSIISTVGFVMMIVLLYGNVWNIVFYVCFVILLVVFCFIWEIYYQILPGRVRQIMIEKNEMDLVYSCFLSYMCMFLPNLMLIIGLILDKFNSTNQMNVLHALAESILTLNFESVYVEKLMNKDTRFCTQLETTLRAIILNMKLYKAYLPESLQVADLTENSVSTLGSSAKSGNSSGSLERIKSTDSASIIPYNRIDDKSTLKKNNATLMYIKLRNCNRLQRNSEKGVIEILSNFLKKIHKIVKKYRGVFYKIEGDEIYFTFNISTINMRHCVKACKASFEIVSLPKFDSTIVLLKDKFIYGNIGYDEMKSFSLVGNYLSKARAISKSCINLGTKVMVNKALFKEISYNFQTRLVELIKYDFEDIDIYQVVKEIHKEKGVEWLYEISSHLEKDSSYVKMYIKMWDSVKTGNFKDAKMYLTNIRDSNKDDKQVDFVLVNIEKKIKNNEKRKDRIKLSF